MFSEIDELKETLNIESYKIKPSELEEIFIKVIAEKENMSRLEYSLGDAGTF